jgi:guanylate kinase
MQDRATKKGKLIILSGPSCVGKTPLKKAFANCYPEMYQQMTPLVLYNSRKPRPNEKEGKDFYFRSREELNKLKNNDQYLVIPVHNDIQVIEIAAVTEQITDQNLLYEGNTVIGRVLQSAESLKTIDKISIYISPLTKSEIGDMKRKGHSFFEHTLNKIMRQKLIRRAQKSQIKMTTDTINDIRRRASDAYSELKQAHHFDYIIPNHDGEDSENWDSISWPVGEAANTLDAFVAILENQIPLHIERWDENTVP